MTEEDTRRFSEVHQMCSEHLVMFYVHMKAELGLASNPRHNETMEAYDERLAEAVDIGAIVTIAMCEIIKRVSDGDRSLMVALGGLKEFTEFAQAAIAEYDRVVKH